MRDIFDFAFALSERYPRAKWIEGVWGGKWYGFAVKRGHGLELVIDIYSTKAQLAWKSRT